ncbi:MAG: PHP domain-containing protein [Actinomycetaceae bacterium]|nr:PHP domain-containing protein [Actinomycetaceae bacterium]
MLRIDPHTHSTHSDGTDTPSGLMQAAAESGLNVVGLTDHDTTAGWEEAAAHVNATGVSLLRGLELSCRWENTSVHLLSYLHDPHHRELVATCERTIDTRKTRARKMVEKLSNDYPITWQEVSAYAPPDGPVGRPHIADALVATGAFPNRNACFEHVLHPAGPYYVHHWAPDPVDATRLIRAAGGVPIIAHPRARFRTKSPLPLAVIEAMIEAGLAGIECDHRDHTAADSDAMKQLARAYNLIVTGSSDYHGTGKPNRLGENLTHTREFTRIVEQGKLEVLHP